MPSSGKVILVACDDRYFYSFALGLIESIERLGKPEALHVLLLEPSSKVVEETAALAKNLKHVKLTYSVDPCVLAQGLKRREIYYTAARFLLAPLVLEAGVERLLMIDVDAVMNRSPWPMIPQDFDRQSGAFIFRRKEKRPWRKILASAVLLNNSPGSMHLANAIASSIAVSLSNKPNYHIDQILPFYACELSTRMFDEFSTSDIPAKLMGYHYEPESAFWTVKGHQALDTFVAERDKLLGPGSKN
ncbi:hypothetical protein [Phyllobacterium sp. YR531]|uniref:hypothetical protein n=1 Tax=Phyllobacterium sp. YR531 TaxID=1144343 RepID=UPI001FCCAE26|nr:hypothetical protein [Phyllobacterium sp. YR531]